VGQRSKRSDPFDKLRAGLGSVRQLVNANGDVTLAKLWTLPVVGLRVMSSMGKWPDRIDLLAGWSDYLNLPPCQQKVLIFALISGNRLN
jgi:hypothetical protein